MADLSFSAEEAYWNGNEASIVTRIADATIEVGQPVYLTDGGVAMPGDADASSTAACIGIALATAYANQHVPIATQGVFNFSAPVLTVGTIYCVSPNAGKICPWADLASGDYVTILGVAESTSALRLDVNATGIAKP